MSRKNLKTQEQEKEIPEETTQRARTGLVGNEFLSRISHDMRTHLNSIRGITTLLQESTTDPGVREDLLQLEQSGKYLLDLIDDTLDLNRIETGSLELHPEVCDGRAIFSTILDQIAVDVKGKEINFKFQTEDFLFTVVYIDVHRIGQIILNILLHAVEHTPRGGDITVTMKSLRVDEGMLMNQIVVENSGTDMAEIKETGLGLTLSGCLAELLGGSIRMDDEREIGNRVTICLPMKLASEKQTENWKKKQKTGRTKHMLEGKRILLCEDHPLNANITTRLLESRGMLVDRVENGAQGVERFRDSKIGYYDAIVMDIRMPVMNGLDATRKIRTLDRMDAAEIPILALTANALNRDRDESKKAGMNAHLSEPVDPEKLFEVLSELLREKKDYIRGKVLIVDDIEVNRAVIREAVRYQFDVIESVDGREAMRVLAEDPGIDAVITDVQMPEMDGYELIRKIRKEKAYDHIAIIANTQYGKPEQEEQLMELGANDFIYKPTTPRVIERRLCNVLKKEK